MTLLSHALAFALGAALARKHPALFEWAAARIRSFRRD